MGMAVTSRTTARRFASISGSCFHPDGADRFNGFVVLLVELGELRGELLDACSAVAEMLGKASA